MNKRGEILFKKCKTKQYVNYVKCPCSIKNARPLKKCDFCNVDSPTKESTLVCFKELDLHKIRFCRPCFKQFYLYNK